MILRFLSALLFATLPIGPAATAAAQTSPSTNPNADAGLPPPWLNIREINSIDIDQDGRFDAIRVFGYWLTSTGDTLMIYGDGREIPATPDYQDVMDLSQSTWVFDVRSAGVANVIVRFSSEGEKSVAYLWDDQNGDGQVSWLLDGTSVVVTESPYWTMKVWTDGDWMRPDGSLNYNLHALFDGCGFCNMTPTGDMYPPLVLTEMQIDGVPDFAIDFIDADDDGIPESHMSRMLAPISETAYGLERFNVNTNDARHVPSPSDDFIFWPLLAPSAGDRSGNLFDSAPYIPIDWDGTFGPLSLGGYPIEQGYHINSYAPVPDGADPVYVNFESPMAYYDLADDHDGSPELHIRLAFGRPNDPAIFAGKLPIPLSEIRYSWNQSNDPGLAWSYKVGLLGDYDVTATTRIGPYNILVPSPDDLPTWCTGKTWNVLTFVATEQGGDYQSSEGIYEWSAAAGAEYLAGLNSSDPVFAEIGKGLRGEYSLRPGKAELYFSPVDRRLHLTGAQEGLWQIDGERQLRYASSAGGDAFDGWQIWSGNQLQEQLYKVDGGFIYSDSTETLFVQTDLPDALFHTLPPVDHAEWLALGELLAANGADLATNDLRTMFDRLGDQPVRIAAGPMGEFQRFEDEVRFVVRSEDDRTHDALTSLIGRSPSPGPQVITYRDGRWDAEASTFAIPTIQLETANSQVLKHSLIQVEITNAGSEALRDAYVQVAVVAPDGNDRSVLAVNPVNVEGHGEQTFGVDWWPRTDGTWQIEATVYREAGSNARTRTTVQLGQQLESAFVQPVKAMTTSEEVQLGGNEGPLAWIALIVGLFLAAGVICGIVLREQRSTR